MCGLKPGSRPAITALRSSSADTQITTASQLPASSVEACERVAVEFLGERSGLLGGAIPHAREKPRPMKIARHVRAHRAQSDKACLHTRIPCDCSSNA